MLRVYPSAGGMRITPRRDAVSVALGRQRETIEIARRIARLTIAAHLRAESAVVTAQRNS
jgi:hypothetical protein